MAFDTTRLVAQVIQRGCLPEGRFSDQDILDLSYDCLLSEIVPLVIDARQDFLVTYVDIPVVAGVVSYPIPARAVNGVVRELKLIYGDQIINLKRASVEDIDDSNSADIPHTFYLVGNNINLYPVPAQTSLVSLRVYYFIRPSKLVPVIETAKITTITGNVLSITTPTGWTSSNTFDLVRGRAHFDIMSIDLVPVSVTASSIEFSAIPLGLSVGDYITLAEETCFPYLPPDGHVALTQSSATACLESIGDPAAANSAAKTSLLLDNFKRILCVRVEGENSLGTPLN
jgi:hypothetical protein